MSRTAAVVLLALSCGGCSFPMFEARSTQVFAVPAAGLDHLVCTSHNGGIQVTGVADATEVRIRAELSVRGHSQEEADRRLDLLHVEPQIAGGTLEIVGTVEDELEWGVSPGFAFAIEAPPGLAARLTSHNGEVVASGLEGDVELRSHNGGITVLGASPRVTAVTRNGAIRAELDGHGPVDGSLTSHNGAIDLRLGSGRSAAIDASTHNGGIRARLDLAGLRRSDGHLSGVAGAGQGHLVLTTHNGGVLIR